VVADTMLRKQQDRARLARCTVASHCRVIHPQLESGCYFLIFSATLF
jgi:hypothetical protein